MPTKVEKPTGEGEWAFVVIGDANLVNWLENFVCNREINKIVIHHTGFDAPFKGAVSWYQVHDAHKRRGWRGIGYHIGISPEGRVYTLRPPNLIGSHCKGHNAHSIGVVVWGRNEKTELQMLRLAQVVSALQKRFGAKIYFHSDLGQTLCPEIDEKKFAKLLKQFGGKLR